MICAEATVGTWGPHAAHTLTLWRNRGDAVIQSAGWGSRQSRVPTCISHICDLGIVHTSKSQCPLKTKDNASTQWNCPEVNFLRTPCFGSEYLLFPTH